MAEIEVVSSQWKLVEVGRVVLFTEGEFTGRLAAIVEIIDHKRVLIDGPSKTAPVPRHSVRVSALSLSGIVLPSLPRAIGNGPLSKVWEKEEVEKKWAESAFAKRREQRAKRQNLSDFERFKVLKLKKQARYQVRRAHASIRKAAK